MKCIICGNDIPEGRAICGRCEKAEGHKRECKWSGYLNICALTGLWCPFTTKDNDSCVYYEVEE